MFDSSHEREPLEFIVGKGKVIPGFDDIVIGMVKGERTKERIEAEKAYGKTTQCILLCYPVCIACLYTRMDLPQHCTLSRAASSATELQWYDAEKAFMYR